MRSTPLPVPRLVRQRTSAPLIALSVAFSGCFDARVVPEIEQIVELPGSFESRQQGGGELSRVPLQRWCSDFDQPELDRLVERAFEANLNLLASWARLEQSAALLDQTRSNLWPQVTLDATASRSKQPAFGGQDLPGLPTSFTNNFYRVEGSVAYEVDLWGKLKAQREAAALDYRASRADVEAAALSLTSSIAEAWFDALANDEKARLLQAQIELNQGYVELLEMRFEQGVSSLLDVAQQRQQIASLKTQRHATVQAGELARQRLAALIGRAPQESSELVQEEGLGLPELPPLPELGVPADLLERRPDLRAATRRLEAANARVAVAVRDRLPSLRLSFSTFLQALELERLLEDVFWSAAAALSEPLVDGGRRRAEVTRAEAAEREAYYVYGQALLTALGEVQGALTSEHYQESVIEDLEAQRELAATSLDLARSRYSRGAFDFLRVLTSQQALQQVEQSLVDAKRRQLANRLQLCRALGGSWTESIAPPAPPRPELKSQ